MTDRIIHLAKSLSLLIAEGSAPNLGQELYQLMRPACRPWLIADAPMPAKAELFAKALDKARLVGIGLWHGRPFGVCWIAPMCPGSNTSAVHIASLARAPASLWRKAGAELLAHAPGCLLCLIPAPLHGAVNLAGELGFWELASLPRSCWLAHRGRAVDGRLMIRNKGARHD